MSGRLYGIANLDQDGYGTDESFKFSSELEANIETSISTHQPNPNMVLHKPQLDLDSPHQYVYSTTPGHGHLKFENEVPWDKYLQWLELSAEIGLIEPGWVKAAKSRGFTSLRKVGVKKTKPSNGYPPIQTEPYLKVHDSSVLVLN